MTHKTPYEPANFPLFVAFWNRFNGMETPRVHLRMASWLGNWSDDETNPGRLLMAFRGCGKSTITGLYIVWSLIQNPNLRVVIISADEALATRMVRHVRRIIERHPFSQHLIPERTDEWASDRFTVVRKTHGRDPSVVSCGLSSNITGMRADLIICDDVEVPNTSDTAQKRDDLRTRLHELAFIQSGRARILYVGTPHTFDTIYATRTRRDVPGHRPFLKHYKCLKIPARNKNGVPAWPEKYPDNVLDILAEQTGHNHFQSQMMLEPVSMTTSYFDPRDLQVYDSDPVFIKELEMMHINGIPVASVSAWWDPALARGRGDKSAVAIVYTGQDGHVFLHRMVYLKVDPHAEQDDATQQCKAVAELMRDWGITVLGLETNGLGRFLPAILRREIVRARAATAVIEVNQTQNKNMRIIGAIETPLAARMLHVHRSVTETPLMDELRDFRMDATRNQDDGLDALSGALSLEPMRIPRSFRHTGPSPHWRARVGSLIPRGYATTSHI